MLSWMLDYERDMKEIFSLVFITMKMITFRRHDQRPVPEVMTHDFGMRHLTAQPPRRNLCSDTV